ncbi:MAG: hypothetical protein LCH30_10775 [Proteobacteria bacterium]|nr:hypothetical protein [Pseudomonadota bacterium]
MPKSEIIEEPDKSEDDDLMDSFTATGDDSEGDIETVPYGEDIKVIKEFEQRLKSIKLTPTEMITLKEIIDAKINSKELFKQVKFIPTYEVNKSIGGIKLSQDNFKINTRIPVTVEEINGRILVKVGPCDLSGVGGHKIREEIIKDLVNQALASVKDESGKERYKKEEVNFSNVNVSACIGVRGRAQMFFRLFTSSSVGSHMNAYVKTKNEIHLTHWEPRKGPQRFFNDTICAMVTSVATSLFEKGIRENTIHSSRDATKNILKNPTLREIFDAVLEKTIDRIVSLVASVTNKVNDLMQSPEAKL